MEHFHLESLGPLTTAEKAVEFVERKGIGHPDTICDGIAEAISISLSQSYLQWAGRILHHNIDKGLLVAGHTEPELGGGVVHTPMRLVIGDRATSEWEGHRISVEEIALESAREWIKAHLPLVNTETHVVFQNELRVGSAELTDIFSRARLLSNDTSAAVGFAPLTETEQLVLESERFLNTEEFKLKYPETGQDVKVMGVRRDKHLQLTLAVAIVDRYIEEVQYYFDRKKELADELTAFLEPQLKTLDGVDLAINTLDNPERGMDGMYLTVLGTSAEGADGGQVGRGNRVNGLITLNRPMSAEAAAGKNPFSHVGKIYNVLCHQLAQQIYDELEPVKEVIVRMCSQIGREISDPWMVSTEVVLSKGVELKEVEEPIQKIIDRQLRNMEDFVRRLASGEFPVY
ncbi:methionine adenosyltransferase [Gimesia benthica]|uniref:Methionine adenosyltransferase n=1 Tax=Gimesia benthica TaxID=2608982 RepID=A0A6I6AH79_9PLAN|nr:methionine adenosyltransferase [Gimesia benthica]QGQ26013.1 methionine adenosyltransferase [Gimesia benthica]